MLPTSPPITENPGQPATTEAAQLSSSSLRPEEVAGIIVGLIAGIIIVVNVVMYMRSRAATPDYGTAASSTRHSSSIRTTQPEDKTADVRSTTSTTTNNYAE
jgi:hypothetical protein